MDICVLIGVVLMFLTTVTLPGDARVVPTVRGDAEMMRRTVEVVVVVDPHAYRTWRRWQLNGTSRSSSSSSSGDGGGDGDGAGGDIEQRTENAITEFVKTVFVSANLIWKGMEAYGVNIDMRIDRLRIVKEDDVVTPMRDGRGVMNDMAIRNFSNWLVVNGFEFDHALLLTGLDLTAPDSSTHEGYAYMDTMCTPLSISIVENIINGIPAVVLAHEVAHSLSARHDGGWNNRCNATSGYIMNANNIGTSPRHWDFSTCSANDIKRKIQTLTHTFDCLSEDSTVSPVVEAPYLGQMYTGDQLCQMTKGHHSYVCRHLYNRPNSKSICEVLYCLVNATYCSGIAPVDGLACGAGKRCLAGSCVPFQDVPEDVTDLCYTGDKPGLAWRNLTCPEVVSSYTHLCRDEWYQDFCCGTCQSYATGDESCPYGDAHSRCAPFYCGTRWESECCVTCPTASAPAPSNRK